jgi:hypothetical protein
MTDDQNQLLTMQLTLGDTNALLELLGRLPYNEVAALNLKIRLQARSSLESQEQEAA